MLRAKAGNPQKYFEKENVIVADCYCLEDGKIDFSENKYGDIEVRIGSRTYEYSPESMYFWSQGSEVKKFQRICSGVVNMNHVISELGTDLSSIYLIFRDQFYTLMDPGYAKRGYTELSSVQEEIIELLFAALTHVDLDPKTLEVDNINYLGTQQGVMGKKSFYTVLSYGYSSKVVSKAIRGDLNLAGDVMTETILGLLLNNKLDENSKK